MDDIDKTRNEQRRALNSRDLRIQAQKDRARDKQQQAAWLAREMAEHYERQLKDAGVHED